MAHLRVEVEYEDDSGKVRAKHFAIHNADIVDSVFLQAMLVGINKVVYEASNQLADDYNKNKL